MKFYFTSICAFFSSCGTLCEKKCIFIYLLLHPKKFIYHHAKNKRHLWCLLSPSQQIYQNKHAVIPFRLYLLVILIQASAPKSVLRCFNHRWRTGTRMFVKKSLQTLRFRCVQVECRITYMVCKSLFETAYRDKFLNVIFCSVKQKAITQLVKYFLRKGSSSHSKYDCPWPRPMD